MSYEAMHTSVERFENAKVDCSVATFKGESLREIYADIGKAIEAEDAGKGEARLAIRSGRKANGEPESWAHTKVGTADIGVRNVSTNCPPKPPEYCI